MKVKCTCGTEYDVDSKLIGKAVRCQKCSQSFVVPVPTVSVQQATVQMTTAASIPLTVPQPQPPPRKAADGSQPTQWVSGPVASSDPKERAEREKQLISQYVAYIPRPGDRLRGAALAKATQHFARRDRMSGALKIIGGGVFWAVLAVVAYFKLELVDTGATQSNRIRGIISLLNLIGGKWGVTIGLGLLALGFILYGTLYWTGFVGRNKKT